MAISTFPNSAATLRYTPGVRPGDKPLPGDDPEFLGLTRPPMTLVRP